MKKIILKTALITFGILLILGVSVFGIVSFFAPAAMMNFFDSLGMKSISGDYAYQEYQNSGDLEYLARAFEIAADAENYKVAGERFAELYGTNPSEREAFYAFCEEMRDEGHSTHLPNDLADFDYGSYLCGKASVVRYRLYYTEKNAEERDSLIAFAIGETQSEFSADSPVIALSLAVGDAHDAEFCTELLAKITAETRFDTENENYIETIQYLKEMIPGNE